MRPRYVAFMLLGLAIALVLLTVNGTFISGVDTSTHEDLLSKSRGAMASSTLKISSPEFKPNAPIPSKYTCDGDSSLSPPIHIEGIPEHTKSLALIVDDPDVPKHLRDDGLFEHWVLFNIPPDATDIPEGGTAGVAGRNGSGQNEYTGPCPPPQHEPAEHRYFFRLFALDTELDLQPGATREQVLDAMQGHIIDEVQLVGRYRREQ